MDTLDIKTDIFLMSLLYVEKPLRLYAVDRERAFDSLLEKAVHCVLALDFEGRLVTSKLSN